MDKKEELLERLVNGIELQNKLLAMQLADSISIPNFMLLDNEQKISAFSFNADIILENIHSKKVEEFIEKDNQDVEKGFIRFQ